jgi:uroporphyrinogen-III decarboxylase
MEDHPAEFDEIIERIQCSESGAYDIVCDFGERYVEFCENLSLEVTGRRIFEKYNMPYYKKINEKLHKAKKKTGIHIDGTLSGLLPLLPQCGFDLAEAVTPAPAGDIELENLRSEAGDDFIIMGGLPGALFSSRYNEKYFDNYLEQLAKISKPCEKFIIGAADQVPPDAEIGRMYKVREMVESNN